MFKIGKKVTDDKWVLETIEKGYKLDFIKSPPLTGIKVTNVPAKDMTFLQNEVQSLLKKDAIEIVPEINRQAGFYSTFFLVPKKTGDMNPVINLRPLNRYIRKQHFKMETLTSVLNLVKTGDWGLSLDLKDAYLHIPIHKQYRQYLRFCLKKGGPCYQFKALCFGPSPSPRVFTKIVAVVAAHLRSQSVRLSVYLDDWIVVNQIRLHLLIDRKKTLNLLSDLGFLINVEKSSPIPSQNITYIGGFFQLKKGLVTPVLDRIQKLKLAVLKILTGQTVLRDFLHLLGILASCIELIPNTRLHMRPIQIHLLHFWRPISMDLTVKIPVTQHLKSHLNWWLDSAHISKGRSIAHWETSVTMTTNASMIGYGGHVNNQIYQGTWSDQEKKLK